MSLANRVDQGIATVRQIDMSAPGALDTDVTLTDLQTGLTFWTNSRSNFIIDITNIPDPAGRYLVKTERNGKERKRWYSSSLLTTFNGESRPGFPVALPPGQLLWVGQQISGGLLATSYLVTLQHDL